MRARAVSRAGVAGSLAIVLALFGAGCGDDELVGLDRVGSPGAQKVLELQINSSYSPQASTPDIAEGFKKLYAQWARRHPDWLLTNPSNLPISVGILNFQGNYATNSTGILAAGSVLAVLPAVLVFVALQRFIVGAFVSGALKG